MTLRLGSPCRRYCSISHASSSRAVSHLDVVVVVVVPCCLWTTPHPPFPPTNQPPPPNTSHLYCSYLLFRWQSADSFGRDIYGSLCWHGNILDFRFSLDLFRGMFDTFYMSDTFVFDAREICLSTTFCKNTVITLYNLKTVTFGKSCQQYVMRLPQNYPKFDVLVHLLINVQLIG